MKIRTVIPFLALILLAPVVSNAQFGNFIKNKASKMLNTAPKESAKEANNKIDSVAQKQAETISNNSAGNQNENGQSNQSENESGQGQGGIDLSKFLGGKVDMKYNDEYSFTSRLYMITETYSKKEVMKIDLYMYFSANTPNVGMETKTITDEQGKTAPTASSIVMDGENRCFIVLSDLNGTKMGMISAIPDENTASVQSDGKPAHKINPTNFSKTGNSKVIAGYTCDEYSYTDQDNKTTGKVWFTKDVNLKIDKRGWQRTGMGAYYGYSGFEGGIVLASETYDEKGKLTIKAETIEINPNFNHSITVKGYSLRQINLSQGHPKNS
jgi:hypothetical protein